MSVLRKEPRHPRVGPPSACPGDQPGGAPLRADARVKSAHDGRRVSRFVATVAVAAAVALGAPAARADNAPPPLSTEQLQLATQLVQAIGIQQVADAALEGLKLVLVQSLAENNKQPPEKVAPVVDQILVPDLRTEEPKFVASVAALYGQVFTAEEMKQILAFYQTPVGQKLQSLQPELTHQMVELGHAWIGQAGEAVLKADAGKLAAQGLKID